MGENVTVPGGFNDLACDSVHGRFWIASQDRLKRWEKGTLASVEIPKDQYGRTRVSSVALDPADANVIYAGNHQDVYSCDNAVVRSTDGGTTWTNLTHHAASGPHEAQWLSVQPATRELWVTGQCYGVWKIPAPSGEKAR